MKKYKSKNQKGDEKPWSLGNITQYSERAYQRHIWPCQASMMKIFVQRVN